MLYRKLGAYLLPYFSYTRRCASFKKNIVSIRITYLISILFLLNSCNRKQKQIDTWNNRVAEYEAETELNSVKNKADLENRIVVADTITNWQFYKDSELLFKSNIVDSNRFSAEINASDNYEYLILTMFYDFNNEVIKRKIELIYDKNILATFVDENRSQSPFKIPKNELDKIKIENIDKDIFINYSDRISKSGMTIGILKFTNN